ncbi:hypothetical protein IFR04_006549 [Cadophora malorum]|uniref:Uncharacterized protein n=1 Tax=Cadophora malorum TaxID=108018 RepID=A0A8H7WAS4_9HELO|nr:hypothetical protein IFR04_006549 [Cadophora malorum]
MYPYPRRGQQLLVFGFYGGSNSLKVGCQFSSGMAHIAPSWVKDWAYAAGKAAIVKVFDYLQAQQPEWHVVQLHPGVVGQGPPELCGHFAVWLASSEAAFLKTKFVWANWDVEEVKARADEIKSSNLLRVALNGVDM